MQKKTIRGKKTKNGRNLAKGKTLSAKMPFKAVQAPKCPKCGKSVFGGHSVTYVSVVDDIM